MSFMDLVVPLGKSKTDYLDLRYALRSIEKFTTIDKVFLIGEKPSWIQNVIHHSYPDTKGEAWKERNIAEKTGLACQIAELSDNFLFSNDDIVFLKETDVENYPYYSKGTCYGSMLKNKSTYRATMNHTRKVLAELGLEDFNADGHCPIIFNKEKFLTSFTGKMWDVPYGYGMKTIYCAKNGIQTEFMKDLKFHTKMTKEDVKLYTQGRHVFSFSDGALKTGVREYLEELLPSPSKYER
jgi:hypothetical protein